MTQSSTMKNRMDFREGWVTYVYLILVYYSTSEKHVA